MKISVIMPIFNNAKYLSGCLDCLLNQTYENWELIVVDDASTEPVIDILNEYSDKHNKIKILVNDENVGLTKSLNICLDMADGDLIARQDSDDISLPTRFEKQVEMLKDKSIGLTSTFGRTVHAEFPEIDGKLPDPYMDKVTRLPDSEIHDSIWKLNCIVGPAAMYPREAFEKIGYYDETLYYSQDYNYWLRISQFFDIKIVREELYLRRRHKKSVRKNPYKQHHKENLHQRVKGRAKTNPIIKERGRHAEVDA